MSAKLLWEDDFIFEGYRLAKDGYTDKEIANELNVNKKTFLEWKKQHKAFANGILKGRTERRTLQSYKGLSKHQIAFLATYAETGCKSQGCEAAFVCYQTQHTWLKESLGGKDGGLYAAAFEMADSMSTDKLEAEARRRAMEGVERLKFHKGLPVLVPCDEDDPDARPHEDLLGNVEYFKPYREKVKSDSLMALMLKAKRPEQYAERKKVEHSGSVGGGAADLLSDLLDRAEKGNTMPIILDAEFSENQANKFLEENGIVLDESKPKKKVTKKKKPRLKKRVKK